jgi:hypothetical protein
MNPKFEQWVLDNARKIIGADYRGLTMLYMARRVRYDAMTFEAIHTYIIVGEKQYNEFINQNILMYNDRRFYKLGDEKQDCDNRQTCEKMDFTFTI